MIEERKHRKKCKTITDIYNKLYSAKIGYKMMTLLFGERNDHYKASCFALTETISEVLEDMQEIFGKEIINGPDTSKDNSQES